jgi:cytochrome c553
MDKSGHEGVATWEASRARFLVSAAAAALALLFATAPALQAADDKPSAADQNCLACHGADGMQKKLGDGEMLSLHVDGATFAKSVHAPLGCTGCHTDIDLKSHPPAAKDIKSARDFSLTTVEICRTCHSDKFEEWNTSVHAALVRDGNVRAPICTGCHSPHAVIKGAAATIEQIPCQRCHQDIYKTYLGSVHAEARKNPATSYAPLCSGCHGAHAIKAVVTLGGPKAACLACHADALEKHQDWLPNAALHFDIVSCPACHAPGAPRQVDLMIFNRESQSQVSDEGVPQFEERPGAAHQDENLDALALWRLLTGLNRGDKTPNIVLRGRLEVSTGPQAHRLADKGKALSNCDTCHRHGSEAFQNVTVSVVGADGLRVRQEASPGVLTSVISTNSLGGFYAIGATRVRLLDALLILAFLGGFAFWVGHLTIRWLYKRYGLNRY